MLVLWSSILLRRIAKCCVERKPGKGYTQGISWLTPFLHHFSLICIFLIVFQWVHFCNDICILSQIIATVIFIFVSYVKNKKSMLRCQSTMATQTEGGLPVLPLLTLITRHRSLFYGQLLGETASSWSKIAILCSVRTKSLTGTKHRLPGHSSIDK